MVKVKTKLHVYQTIGVLKLYPVKEYFKKIVGNYCCCWPICEADCPNLAAGGFFSLQKIVSQHEFHSHSGKGDNCTK
jgi:hypothetical protein